MWVRRRNSMTEVAVTPAEEFALLDWLKTMVLYAVGFAISAALLGGVLNLTWNELANAFSFLDPLGGYWHCVLATLGAYGAFLVYDSARAHKTSDVLGDFSGTMNVAGKIGVLLGLAWVATQLA
jgi:hypothetical protein